jgi:methionyl-tRNA formyltransferase
VRVIFYGTPEFAVPSLNSLLKHHEVALVVSRPPRPAGRGMSLRPSPVADAAEIAGVPLLTPEKVKGAEAREAILEAKADIAVVAAYGQILPAVLLDGQPHGALNVHASLLPRWRGASPVTAAILAGDAKTGVSLMRLEPTLDTGPVLLQRSLRIAPTDTTATLTARLARLGADTLLEGLERIAAGEATFQPQPEAGVTYAGMVSKADGDLSWDLPAEQIARALRAYDPWPGVRLPLGDQPLRVIDGAPLPGWTATAGLAPGTIAEVRPDGLAVAAGNGLFLLRTVQPAGKQPMPAAAYARGRRDLVLPGKGGG